MFTNKFRFKVNLIDLKLNKMLCFFFNKNNMIFASLVLEAVNGQHDLERRKRNFGFSSKNILLMLDFG